MARALRSQLELLPGRVRTRLRLAGDRPIALDPGEVRAPDSAVSREAEALCAEVSPAYLAAHCHRSYLWAALFGARERLSYDAELLYVSCMLHDLGLTGSYAGGGSRPACFSIRGAEAALGLASEAGWPPGRGEVLADAIVLHLNPEVRAEHGPEAHLLQAGTAMDVVGQRHWEIDAATRDMVCERHPRQGLTQALPSLWREQGAVPGTRGELLSRVGRLERRIRRAPFAE